MSVCALSILLTLLVVLDPRVRQEVTQRMNATQASVEIAAAQSRSHRLAALVVEVASEQTRQHGPFVIFLAVATMLTVFMVRI